MDNTVELHAAGQVAVNVFGFVLATGGFSLDKKTITGSDGKGITFTNAPALIFTITGAEAFIGAVRARKRVCAGQ